MREFADLRRFGQNIPQQEILIQFRVDWASTSAIGQKQTSALDIQKATENSVAIIKSMHPDLIKLTEWLDEAASLLRQHQIENWASWLSKDAQRVRSGDFYGIEHLRSAFGGMGSLNDLGLAVPNPDKPSLVI